jgi:hypothetical protein
LKTIVLKLKEAWALFKPGDALVYGLVAVIMVAGFVNMRIMMENTRDRLAIVEMDGKVIHTVRLEQNMEAQKIRVDADEGKYNIVFIEYDFIEIMESNCPDQVCVGWGRIRYAGQTIVCLPFRIVIRITGRAVEDPIDDITW